MSYLLTSKNKIKWEPHVIKELLERRKIVKNKKDKKGKPLWPPNRSYSEELCFTSSCTHTLCSAMNRLAHADNYENIKGWKCQCRQKEIKDLTIGIVYNESLVNQIKVKRYDKIHKL